MNGQDEREALQRRVHELEEIHRLAASLTAMASQVGMLEEIADVCLHLCRADRAAILLLDSAGSDPAHTVVRSGRDSAAGIPHILNSIMAGWILKHRTVFSTDDVYRGLNLHPSPNDRRRPGPALAVPLMHGGDLIGFLHILREHPGPAFSDESRSIAEIIAPLAARSIGRARMHESLQKEAQSLRTELQRQPESGLMVGESPAIVAVRSMIERVAPTAATVLLIGETGTGKELVARAIHFRSPRASRPFIPLNCSAIPESLFESELFGHERGSFTGATELQRGAFEEADGGTLFLDEIGTLPLELQPKLLRVLESHIVVRLGSTSEHAVNVRLIAASGTDLSAAVERHEFRRDLFHRLNVVPIMLPPLRERQQDIAPLAQFFLSELSQGRSTFAPDALDLLQQQPWRGNVRELRNIVERASLFLDAERICADDLRAVGLGTGTRSPDDLTNALRSFLRLRHDNQDLTEDLDRRIVRLALDEVHGNISGAARLLGIDRAALQRRIRKYDMTAHGELSDPAD